MQHRAKPSSDCSNSAIRPLNRAGGPYHWRSNATDKSIPVKIVQRFQRLIKELEICCEWPNYEGGLVRGPGRLPPCLVRVVPCKSSLGGARGQCLSIQTTSLVSHVKFEIG